MLYLSQVLGRPIRDLEGERVAVVKDVIVGLGEDHPPVTGVVARYRRRDFFLPRASVRQLDEGGVRLSTDILNLRPFARREGEVLLARDVLDKQLIDVDGKRVVRVNDVQLIEVADGWRVTRRGTSAFRGCGGDWIQHKFIGTTRAARVLTGPTSATSRPTRRACD